MDESLYCTCTNSDPSFDSDYCSSWDRNRKFTNDRLKTARLGQSGGAKACCFAAMFRPYFNCSVPRALKTIDRSITHDLEIRVSTKSSMSQLAVAFIQFLIRATVPENTSATPHYAPFSTPDFCRKKLYYQGSVWVVHGRTGWLVPRHG